MEENDIHDNVITKFTKCGMILFSLLLIHVHLNKILCKHSNSEVTYIVKMSVEVGMMKICFNGQQGELTMNAWGRL